MEIVRAGFDAYNRGDLAALVRLYAPDVEFETLMLGKHRGPEAIHRLFEENREALSGYRLDPEELIPVGEDKVVAVTSLGGSGPVSGIALGDKIAFVMTWQDGLLVRQQSFRNKQEALEAAGLSE